MLLFKILLFNLIFLNKGIIIRINIIISFFLFQLLLIILLLSGILLFLLSNYEKFI